MEGKGWTDAEDLETGDQVRQADGTTGIVWLKWNVYKTQEMYNLTVDTAHTFFVGDGQWLVHNTCNPKKIHGNSLDSPKETAIYEIVDVKTGDHLKFGITSNPKIENRYTQKFLEDKEMITLFTGSRREMYDLEASLILNNPRGPLQHGAH